MRCSVCGEEHSGDELELSYRRPDVVASLSHEERETLVQENSDLCVLKGERFFVRGVFPLPVEGRVRPYNIGLWVEVSQLAFERIYELWDEPSQASEPPFEARIANDLPFMSETLGALAALHLSGPASRPNVVAAPGHAGLHDAQVNGISQHRASEYTAIYA